MGNWIEATDQLCLTSWLEDLFIFIYLDRRNLNMASAFWREAAHVQKVFSLFFWLCFFFFCLKSIVVHRPPGVWWKQNKNPSWISCAVAFLQSNPMLTLVFVHILDDLFLVPMQIPLDSVTIYFSEAGAPTHTQTLTSIDCTELCKGLAAALGSTYTESPLIVNIRSLLKGKMYNWNQLYAMVAIRVLLWLFSLVL